MCQLLCFDTPSFNYNKGITHFLIHVGLQRYNTERDLSYLYKIAELSTDN